MSIKWTGKVWNPDYASFDTFRCRKCPWKISPEPPLKAHRLSGHTGGPRNVDSIIIRGLLCIDTQTAAQRNPQVYSRWRRHDRTDKPCKLSASLRVDFVKINKKSSLISELSCRRHTSPDQISVMWLFLQQLGPPTTQQTSFVLFFARLQKKSTDRTITVDVKEI